MEPDTNFEVLEWTGMQDETGVEETKILAEQRSSGDPIDEAVKHVDDLEQKYESEIMRYASEEIQRCKNESLKFVMVEVERHKEAAFQRRKDLMEDIAANMQQVQSDEMRFIVEELENYKKETVGQIEKQALTKVDAALTHVAVKTHKETVQALPILIGQPLIPIAKDTQNHVVSALKDILEGKWANKLQHLHSTVVQENQKKFNSDYQRCTEEANKIVWQETPRCFKEALTRLDDELPQKINVAIGSLQNKASRCGEVAMKLLIGKMPPHESTADEEDQVEKYRAEIEKRLTEEMQRSINKLGNVFQQAQKSKEEAMNFLVNNAREREVEGLRQMDIEFTKYVEETADPKVKEQSKQQEEIIQKLVEEAKKEGEEILRRVIEQAGKKVATMVMDMVQEALRSIEKTLKSFAGNIPEVEDARKRMFDTLRSLQKPVDVKPIQIWRRNVQAEQVG